MEFVGRHKPLWLFLILSFVNIFKSTIVHGHSVNQNPYRHFVTLDRDGRYNLEWLVDWDQKLVRFNLTVATRGTVVFGLARNRNEEPGGDLIIGGVLPDGKPYFSDRYALGDQMPTVDPTTQDWTLNSARENRTHTFLSFSRLFDTCDADYDIPITDDVSTIIWAYSEVDEESQWIFRNRGEYDVYLLDPDLSPDLEQFKALEQAGVNMNMSRFPMTAELDLPPVDTMYWCHFFRGPTTSKRHIIGFDTNFPTDSDRQHHHHILVHRCKAPPGVDPDSLFEDATRTKGTECFFVGEPHQLPTENCQEVIHLWGVGGRPIFFPDTAGLAMSANGTEYFMIQVHYDNPQILNKRVTFTVDAYYTDNLRENDVGMLPLGEQTPAATSIVIPPNSPRHAVLGHCPPECLQKMLPPEGVQVFAGFLHTHLLGNGVRFLHFRGDKELPWIANADNYNFNYQQFRLLMEERGVLPGDQLGMRCSYDTTSRNGATIVGGHSTRDEMCTGHLYYYTKPPISFSFCRSELRTEEYMNRLGIRNTTWDASRRQMMVTDPPYAAGLTVYEYANRYINWTPEMREAIVRDHKFQPQATQCPIVDDTPPDPAEWAANENIAWNPSVRGVLRYRRPPQCTRDEIWPGTLTRGNVRSRNNNPWPVITLPTQTNKIAGKVVSSANGLGLGLGSEGDGWDNKV